MITTPPPKKKKKKKKNSPMKTSRSLKTATPSNMFFFKTTDPINYSINPQGELSPIRNPPFVSEIKVWLLRFTITCIRKMNLLFRAQGCYSTHKKRTPVTAILFSSAQSADNNFDRALNNLGWWFEYLYLPRPPGAVINENTTCCPHLAHYNVHVHAFH